MNEKILKTLKSVETEDWVDYHIVRPISYYMTRAFARFDVHPNTVTIWSMIVGAASCLFFAHGCLYYNGWSGLLWNLGGIGLLIIADLLDCTDGQLARMTGKKSRMGRILDGIAGYTWYIPIYTALVVRFFFHHEIEFGWLGIEDTTTNTLIATAVVLALALWSGLGGIGPQQRLADYYIQIHLFFLKGEKGSELDNSIRQQEIYDEMRHDPNVSTVEKVFQKSYVDYTQKQEEHTPQFQRLMRLLKEKFGKAGNMPAEVRQSLHDHSLKIIPWNSLLTFNFRTLSLVVFTLIDLPVLNFLWEGIGMTLLACWINHRHEAFCKKIADTL